MNWKYRQLFNFEAPEDGGGGDGAVAPVPGIGEVTPDPSGTPAAEPNNTDEPARDLGPIPYSRFKEVNDRRRELESLVQPYVDLESVGYGVEDLHRLTAWEREYQQDPVAVWLRQAAEIENLPEPVKAAIAAISEGDDGPKETPADGTPPVPQDLTPKSGDDGPPEWAKPLLEEYQTRQQSERQQAIDGTLDAITHTWGELDKTAGINAPSQRQMLRYIQTSTGETAAEILKSAREAWLADREELLAAEVKQPGGDGRTVPQSVPGSGAGGTGAPPVVAKTLREATKNALTSIELASKAGG